MLVLTGPETGPSPFSDTLLAAVGGILMDRGHAVGDSRVLSDGVALEIPFQWPEGGAKASWIDVRDRVRKAVGDLPIDANIVPAVGRRKKILIADMDSTVITSESLDDLAAYAGLAEKIAPITARAMRGELDFEAALKERVGMLAGLDAAVLDKLVEEVRVTDGAAEMVATMRANDAYTALVSGGFRSLTSPIRKRLGFHEDRSNTLIVSDGQLTGKVADPVLDKNAKVTALEEIAGKLKLSVEDAVTVGDGANDIPMLGSAGLGVAFRGKPAVEASAPCAIRHADLRGLLYLQGYTNAEISTGV